MNSLVDPELARIKQAFAWDATLQTAFTQKGLTVNGNIIVDNTIIGAKIADNAITGAKIADNAITGAKIADNAITDAKISGVSAAKITTGDIAAARMSTNVVDAVNMNGFPIRVQAFRATGDPGGISNNITFTASSNTGPRGRGVGTILFSDAINRDNVGFIKIYIGTLPYYIPIFSAS